MSTGIKGSDGAGAGFLPGPPRAARRHGPLVLLLLIIVAVAARARTFGNPVIGFDEQFYLLVGARLWDGALPFVDLFDRKPVGLFMIYAAARGLGGDGFLQYKLLALASVVATAFLIYRVARRNAATVAAVTVAVLYIAWLDLMEGEGGQSPVFYNLPMIAAGALISGRQGTDPLRRGALAMLFVGVALQMKYSAVFEGVLFGCWLVLASWRAGAGGYRLLGSAVLWIASALAPTALAFGAYAALGHADAFVYANFVSALARPSSDPVAQAEGAAIIAGILAPLWLALVLGWRGRTRPEADPDTRRFLWCWLVVAIAAIILYGRYASPHYAMPVLLPLTCLLAPALDARRARRIGGMIVAVAALIGGQVVLSISEAVKGGAAEAAAVSRLAAPHGRGCIWVYDGYPALYLLTGSCLPTRFAFPGHLNTREEGSGAGLGIDPAAEVERILARRPVAIVDDYPTFEGGNVVTRRILRRTLDARYALAGCVRTGPRRVRLVYRPKTERPVRPDTCPSDDALRRGH